MKLKNIPADISSKSIKEALKEIKDIIMELDDDKADLKNSIDKYNRMMLLNMHIQEQFKRKANEIKKTSLDKDNKNSPKAKK